MEAVSPRQPLPCQAPALCREEDLMAKFWKCIYMCGIQISEMGAYVKLSSTKYAHLYCHEAVVAADAHKRIMNEIREKEQQEREAREREAQEAREQAMAAAEQAKMVAERERTNRIIAAQNNPLPPKLVPTPQAPPKPKEPEVKKDRMELLDLD